MIAAQPRIGSGPGTGPGTVLHLCQCGYAGRIHPGFEFQKKSYRDVHELGHRTSVLLQGQKLFPPVPLTTGTLQVQNGRTLDRIWIGKKIRRSS